eukprot:4589599-Pleurochrysis_carterae.AAC.1
MCERVRAPVWVSKRECEQLYLDVLERVTLSQASPCREWYEPLLEPMKHYLPVSRDTKPRLYIVDNEAGDE